MEKSIFSPIGEMPRFFRTPFPTLSRRPPVLAGTGAGSAKDESIGDGAATEKVGVGARKVEPGGEIVGCDTVSTGLRGRRLRAYLGAKADAESTE